ncbi:MAG: hypothetical protein ABI680_00440 [Chthoniobacteraceae bacterium]
MARITFPVLLALAAIGLFLLTLWSPERQVRLHQRNLLEAVSKRNWERAASFIADEYSDRWGHDKGNVIELGREGLRHFLFLNIEMKDERITVVEKLGRVETELNVRGSPASIADGLIDRVESVRQPFGFRWEHRSWKPWDWKLIEFDQPELRLEEWGG